MRHHYTMAHYVPFDSDSSGGFLDGKMLVATPSMQDERFARSVIYICAHSAEGAMGIVVNQPAKNIKFPDLLKQLGVIDGPSDSTCPARCADPRRQWRPGRIGPGIRAPYQ